VIGGLGASSIIAIGFSHILTAFHYREEADPAKKPRWAITQMKRINRGRARGVASPSSIVLPLWADASLLALAA